MGKAGQVANKEELQTLLFSAPHLAQQSNRMLNYQPQQRENTEMAPKVDHQIY